MHLWPLVDFTHMQKSNKMDQEHIEIRNAEVSPAVKNTMVQNESRFLRIRKPFSLVVVIGKH